MGQKDIPEKYQVRPHLPHSERRKDSIAEEPVRSLGKLHTTDLCDQHMTATVMEQLYEGMKGSADAISQGNCRAHATNSPSTSGCCNPRAVKHHHSSEDGYQVAWPASDPLRDKYFTASSEVDQPWLQPW